VTGACGSTNRALLALVEDDLDIHAGIFLLTARVSVVDDGCRVTFNGQRASALVVFGDKPVGSLHLQVYGVAAVRPRANATQSSSSSSSSSSFISIKIALETENKM